MNKFNDLSPAEQVELLRTKRTQERFWSKVDKDSSLDGCWTWTAGTPGYGYGEFRVMDRMLRAHRVSYMIEHGPIENGLVIDHRCANKACVNPNHLRAVEQRYNTQHLTGAYKTSVSGVRGVRQMSSGRWQGRFRYNGKETYVGTFDTREEAERVTIAARRKCHTHDDHEEWLTSRA